MDDVMNFVVAKIIVTVLLILALAWVAEKASPRIAGILSGYPIGTALVLFFYGLQSGPEFAVATVPYNLLGHASALAFAYCYFLGARSSSGRVVLLSSILAMAGYGLVAVGLSYLQLPVAGGVVVSAVSIALFSFLFRKAPNHVIHKKVSYTLPMVVFRISISTVLVLVVTALAQTVGVKWAGLFSAFPLAVFPVVLLIHITYGHEQARTVLKNFPRGLWTVLIYSVTVSLTYGRFGVYWGTAIGYLFATMALLGINWRVFMDRKGEGGFST
jgi:hypothetical protein